ncbi:DinB family protein [Algoriphagus antarcticus]|uniref:DinB family protein n=1 Tax=Algoriphagus antarcticus TaxID=238540 RepID=A0A3E0DYP1_9BACT|nr:DinB family protein [Algoriphagus antarcticus]REG88689.1 DinB family protein [Algoriphagus antarcticus]
MDIIQKLIQDVARARTSYLENIAELSEAQARWKPEAEAWNILEITEHLFWAEQGGLLGMWKSLTAIRDGGMIRTFESNHKNMSIEQVIELTWKTKEIVPDIAAPRLGSSFAFWKSSLQSLQEVLDVFGHDLQEDELKLQAQPHPISGALDFHQRIEFLRFHIDRHREQVAQLLSMMNSSVLKIQEDPDI